MINEYRHTGLTLKVYSAWEWSFDVFYHFNSAYVMGFRGFRRDILADLGPP